MSTDVLLQSKLTCPKCGHRQIEEMPSDACQWFYECTQCHTLLKPKPGDCCVYCSYGSVPCPPIQLSLNKQKKEADHKNQTGEGQ